MLVDLAIKNFAIIDDIRISFSKGLTILTGETGAGKSIIIEAVNLLLGGRASGDLVRTGKETAELEAFFEIDSGSNAAKIMEEHDLDPSEGLIIRRVISSRGRHRLFINSKQSTMHMLKLVTENLAGISSQHAHHGFLNRDKHIDILDQFAKTLPLRKEVSILYNKFSFLKKEIASLREELSNTSQDNEFLRFQINEIEDAALLPNEDEELETKRKRLKNSSSIIEIVNRSADIIYSADNSIIEKLGNIKNSLEKLGEIDPVMGDKSGKLYTIILELEDFTEEIKTYASTIELDAEALDAVETRLDFIQKLKRKYGGSLESLFMQYEDLKKKVSGTENIKEKINDLTKEMQCVFDELNKKSLLLSEKRKIAGKKLGSLIETELKDLEMNDAVFIISVETINKCELDSKASSGRYASDNDTDEFDNGSGNSCDIQYSATGIDKVCFLIASNPGEDPKPLNRVASGGELSRIVLALKAVLSETESLDTLIFDEVDAGIGGKTSEKVGIKLKKLAEDYQVICITHLAQIAKYGDSHFKIQKSVVNGRTATSIVPLTEKKDRINEIARMIGGEEITPAALSHAEEMLDYSNI